MLTSWWYLDDTRHIIDIHYSALPLRETKRAKRCVFMTVARQICILEYGVSFSCKRGLKRTQTKTGVSVGGGGGGGGI